MAVAVTCAQTDDQAHRLAAPAALSFLPLRSGRPTTLPTSQETESYAFPH